MKRVTITTLTLLFAIFTLPTKAQSTNDGIIAPPTNEIRIQISDGLPLVVATAVMDIATDIFGTVLTFGNYKSNRDEQTGSPHFGMGYKYHVNNRFSLGANLSYQNITTTYKLTHRGDASTATGTRKISLITVMPSFEYKYIKRESFQFYGNADVGIAIGSISQKTNNNSNDDSSSGVAFGFQANPVGLRFGNKIGGFIELGAGYKGFITVGLSANF